METKLEHSPAYERFREALETGRYPSGARFVDAEAPHAKTWLLRSAREGKPVVLVFPDGEERIVSARRPDAPRTPVAPPGLLVRSTHQALDRLAAFGKRARDVLRGGRDETLR